MCDCDGVFIFDSGDSRFKLIKVFDLRKGKMGSNTNERGIS